MNNNDNTVRTGNAILHAVIAVPVFYIVYTIAIFLITGVMLILFKIPVVSELLTLIIHNGGNSATSFSMIIAVGISVFSVIFYIAKFTKNDATASRAAKIFAVFMVLFNIVNGVINLTSDSAIFINVIMAIGCGSLFFLAD